MRSFMPWIGGKSLLSNGIVRMMPPHKCYAEVFGGGAWVLFAKPKYKTKGRRVEVYNDINGELVNLFLTVKQDLDSFIEAFDWLPGNSREIFFQFKNEDPRLLNPLQRAVRFYYVLKNSVNGNMDQFSYSTDKRPKKMIHIKNLNKIKSRLETVYIEQLPFKECIKRYDGEDTFFYLDPPYVRQYEERQRYTYYFRKKDHKLLRDTLKGVKGTFILSYNDNEEIRKLYKKFEIKEVEVVYSATKNLKKVPVGRRKRPIGKELLISNFKSPTKQLALTTGGL